MPDQLPPGGSFGAGSHARTSGRLAWLQKFETTSTIGDGGATNMVAASGAVSEKRFSKKRKRNLTVHQKAHAAYAMVKQLMPRMKKVHFTMWNHFGSDGAASGLPFHHHRVYSGKDTFNVAALIHDRSGISDLETPYYTQRDVIASGHSMAVRSALVNSNMLKSAIFPMSHPGLILKGDNQDQRLGDFVELAGMHMYGRIEVNQFAPIIAATSIPYVTAVDAVAATQYPSSPMLDKQRTIRLMLIEVIENLAGSEYPTALDDELYYGNTTWSENPDTGGGTPRMKIMGAPRIEHILDIDSFTTLSNSVTMKNYRKGRWTKIDRHYRSNQKNDNIWLDPAAGRKIDFKVWKDMTFTLSPNAFPKKASNDTERTPSVSRTSYVNIDMFVKLNVDLSYVTEDATDSKSTTAGYTHIASRNLNWYIFDDHMDHILAVGKNIPTSTFHPDESVAPELIMEGYTMSQARIECDIFFNDDL